MARRGELLLADGSRVTLRRIPHPGFMTHADAQALVEAYKRRSNASELDGAEYEVLIREALGDSYLEYLREEGQEVSGWLHEFAHSARDQVMQIGFVTL